MYEYGNGFGMGEGSIAYRSKMTPNEFGNQLTAANRQATTADWDTHYKRQQSTSWLDSRLQRTERGIESIGASMEFILFLLVGFLSLAEGQSEWM